MKTTILALSLLAGGVLAMPTMAADTATDGNANGTWNHKGMHKDANGNWVDSKGVRYDSSGKPVTGDAARDNKAPGLADTTRNPDVEGGGPNQK